MESRRSFLRFLAGGAAAALAPAIPLIPSLATPVAQLRRYSTFTEIVTETLRAHAGDLLADNIAKNNALFRYLQEKKRLG